MTRDGLLLVGHGSREPQTRIEHDVLEQRVQAHFAGWRVASGFIELSDPPLSIALEQIAHACDRVVVAPLLLFNGGHMQRDIPNAIARVQTQLPRARFIVSEPFGLSPDTLQLASTRIRVSAQSASSPELTVLLVGRGAAETQAQQAFQRVLFELADRHRPHHFVPAYCGVQEPDVATALRDLAQQGARRVLVVPYLLFTGRLVAGIAKALAAARVVYPTLHVTLCEHLGPDAASAVIGSVERSLPPKS